jgi:hypothetical protein
VFSNADISGPGTVTIVVYNGSGSPLTVTGTWTFTVMDLTP